MIFMNNFLFKTPILFSTVLVLGLSFGLSACSNNENAKPKYKTIQTLNQQHPVETGTVVSVRTVQIQPEAINSYGNVGVAASSSGFRGIYGSIDLATLGRIFKNTTGPKTAQEVIVKKNNGQTVAITQVAKETFNRGDSVKILVRKGEARVTH